MQMSTIIRVAVMIIGAVIAFIGMNKQKEGATWGQPVAILGAVIAIIAALWGIVRNVSGADYSAARDRELEYQRIQTRHLGEYLASKFAGSKALVIKDTMLYYNFDGSEIANPLDTQLEGLKQGIGSAITIVNEVCPPLPKLERRVEKGPNGEEMPMDELIPPMEMWFKPADLDKLLKSAGDYDMIIALVSFPMGSFGSKSPAKATLEKKKVVLIGGDSSVYGYLFKQGIAVAAVTHNPNAVYDDEPIPSDKQKAFDKRYLMLTAENYESVMKANAQMFNIK
ncbi:MAG: hypothetical protein J6866_02150 [Victivallales bacterium]|nr:hypothetical protein [Victivallales bacterium]